jgi:hypothetical protein
MRQNLTDAVERIILQVFHGRRHELDEALDAARDDLAERISLTDEGILDDVVDGIRWGAVTGRARGTSKTIIRVISPDGSRLTYELHAEADGATVQAVIETINRRLQRVQGGDAE